MALRHEGTKSPLWLIHSGVGEVLVFLGLSKHVNDRPVYALRAGEFWEYTGGTCRVLQGHKRYAPVVFPAPGHRASCRCYIEYVADAASAGAALLYTVSVDDRLRLQEELSVTLAALGYWKSLAYGLQSLAINYEPFSDWNGRMPRSATKRRCSFARRLVENRISKSLKHALKSRGL